MARYKAGADNRNNEKPTKKPRSLYYLLSFRVNLLPPLPPLHVLNKELIQESSSCC